jgi:hypothetical protein
MWSWSLLLLPGHHGEVTDLDLSGHRPVFEEDFAGPDLDRSRWLPYYLPHWGGRQRSAARYEVRDGLLRLRIDADQPPWHPELDGDLRVSALQTGVRSGPVGSRDGQHRFHPDAVVVEEQPAQRLYTPQYGVVEIRMQALADPSAMVALWMIGFEDTPERSAEICVCEIFGSEAGEDRALVGVGVHPFGDPAITDDFEKVEVAVDVREFHTYAVWWTPERVDFHVDGHRVKRVAQSPAYPMQLMLTIYEFTRDAASRYPKEFVVDRVRGYAPA